ncbi:hypothetical protein ATCV1_z435R [Acanthocystis turfacea chlorella virus 1]|uniref:Uncharacterized protein z435R n=1 Tax=Chlorovirus heliozoae TaxID=322019 RepID=A7K945_9PHYC|nr:hypothetical protein ATCV1_z435R [Acanthocystis turfacea chlorella virus 1]ABT16569.1 hypothetical protein ATCV1_z435R [Acanthocystis turfacea chlorella virus 1]
MTTRIATITMASFLNVNPVVAPNTLEMIDAPVAPATTPSPKSLPVLFPKSFPKSFPTFTLFPKSFPKSFPTFTSFPK